MPCRPPYPGADANHMADDRCDACRVEEQDEECEAQERVGDQLWGAVECFAQVAEGRTSSCALDRNCEWDCGDKGKRFNGEDWVKGTNE